jgi:hypothetical protein
VKSSPSSKPWLVAGLILIAISGGGALWIGLHYWHNPDYWLVAIPGFGTAVGTIALAGATFRLIQREGAERENTRVALEHSQTIAEQSQTAALEAARHRRDDRARLLRITPWQGIKTYLDTLENSALIKDGHHFDIPMDANQKLLVVQVFEVLPAGRVPMTATFNSFTIGGEKHIGMKALQVPLGWPHKSLAWFSVERTVAEWVEIYQQRATRQLGDEGHAWVSVDDTFDDGVLDSYEVVQSGCPLKKSPDLEGRWILDATGTTDWNTPQVAFAPLPLRRLYYISKTANKALG